MLKRTDFGEADKILTLYTPHLGKLRAIAKGVRRPTSRLGGNVELFTHSSLLIARGRNLDIVTQSETIHSFIRLRENLHKTSCTCYVAEVMDRLTEERIENYPSFDLLLRTLDRISEGPDPQRATLFFEIQVMAYLGYRPELHRCTRCQVVVGPSTNFFSPVSGGILCLDCGQAEPTARGITTNAFKVLRLFQEGDFTRSARVRLDEPLRRELDSLLRGYVQYILEHELKSASLLDSLQHRSATFDAKACQAQA
ncbi:MAG: DNA repair protein RecO [Chloroflexi bacterium]|nr:DNA repair protein RecO [Chloroflexota bacterium]